MCYGSTNTHFKAANMIQLRRHLNLLLKRPQFENAGFILLNKSALQLLLLDVMLSAIGVLFWCVVFSVWRYVYTVSRAERAEWADRIT